MRLPKTSPSAPIAAATTEEQNQDDDILVPSAVPLGSRYPREERLNEHYLSVWPGPFSSGASLSGGISGMFWSGSTSGTSGMIPVLFFRFAVPASTFHFGVSSHFRSYPSRFVARLGGSLEECSRARKRHIPTIPGDKWGVDCD